ncbi:hypothetical protein SISNIDRAFT_51270 [Sistotremastrum niveocremeum HHB9708]|uniref:HIT-type domain-containing protein n=1 Tax=Sistotremastrum niveocremeum HHB9708 TaxID=1314777 RepID=A0A164W0E9_9AGAM|nr:hypothetical protein SISNIDRAFT_51270 [Sistotremastrum niveocremeum HHB9708]
MPEIVVVEHETEEKAKTCVFCRRQVSRYLCPTCNAPYCSLTCFRHQSHSQCSEAFYKREIETDIQSGTSASKSAQERTQMLGILKRFEEESAEEEWDENSLAMRLGDLDLDSLSAEALWEKLNEEEKARFLRTVNDPDGEAARQILNSEVLLSENVLPWWEGQSGIAEGEQPPSSRPQRYGSMPTLIEVPGELSNRAAAGPSLIFNIATLCLAYAYVTRTMARSPLSSLEIQDAEYEIASELMQRSVPFVFDMTSKERFSSFGEGMTYLWSRIGSACHTFF